jgi:hypothetical protein
LTLAQGGSSDTFTSGDFTAQTADSLSHSTGKITITTDTITFDSDTRQLAVGCTIGTVDKSSAKITSLRKDG